MWCGPRASLYLRCDYQNDWWRWRGGWTAPASGKSPQYGKSQPVSPDGYCSIIYNENLRATLMFNYNRLSVRTLWTMENHAVINIIFCVATWNRVVKVDKSKFQTWFRNTLNAYLNKKLVPLAAFEEGNQAAEGTREGRGFVPFDFYTMWMYFFFKNNKEERNV